MKKSISVILMLAMLLSSVLAIIPMSAATEDTSNGIKVNFGDIPYRTLVGGKESAYDFISVYDVILDGNSLATVANSNTPNEKSFELGYVAQSEYAITSDSYYVYEFKAKLNRDTGYAGVVFASNGTEHYFAGGAFANDGDHKDAEGNQASHIALYKNKWAGNLNADFGDHYKIPAFVEDGYGSWRVVYDGLTVNMQYLAKDGLWTYITHEDGSKASITLPEGFFVAFGAHNRGGAVKAQRTVSIKDAIIYNGPVSNDSGITPVDKTALDAYIKYVEKTFFDSAKYEVSIWAAFENALTAARDVSAKEGISQDVIDARLADLQNAVAVLKAYEEDTVYTDKTALYAYIEYVEKTFVYSVKYEASSWAKLESALATAKDVSTQDNISQYDVDQALAALKYAVSALKINNFGNDVLLDGIVPEKVDFGSLTYKTLDSGKESVYNFSEMYDVIIDGNSLNTVANNKTSEEKSFNLGYVAQSEYAITSDSYYVYEFKAKLNRKSGYAGVVFAANGTEYYFAGGAFANDGDHNDVEGNRASHIRLYKNEWAGYLNAEFGDHMTIPVLVDEDGYGSWRVIYDGLIIKMQYLAKDGTWTYITNDNGTLSCLKLPEGYYVAFGAHNRGGAPANQRTVNIRDAVFYNINDVGVDDEINPIISTAEDFMSMKEGGDYVLANDIVLPWDYAPINFSGTLNGNGYDVIFDSGKGVSIFNELGNAKIYNVTFRGSSKLESESGFVAARAVGETVLFENVFVDAYLDGVTNTAGYIGTVESTVKSLTFKNCSFIGNIFSNAYAGGFIGQINMHIGDICFENCTVGADGIGFTISGNGRVAGFVAKTLAVDNTSAIYLTFKNCVNFANITGAGDTASAVGSLVGRVNRTNVYVDNCTNYGYIFSESTKNTRGVGGLIGEVIYNCNVNITSSANNGDVTTVAGVPGGLIGISSYRSYVTIGALTFDGNVDASKACYNFGNINQIGDWAYGSGGMIGYVKSNSFKPLMNEDSTPNEVRIYGAVNNGNITTALSCVGGMIGMTDDSARNVALLEVIGCVNNGDLVATGGNNVGGMGGQTPGMVVKFIDCTNNGYVRSIDNEAGGIYGRSYAVKGELIIDGCVNNGRVEATKWVGGIASGIEKVGTATIRNCVNNGIVVTTSTEAGNAGGIVRCINNGYVSGCKNNGIVAAVTSEQIVCDNWGGAEIKYDNVENGATVSDSTLIAKAQTVYGVSDYTDPAAYADVVKAFAIGAGIDEAIAKLVYSDNVAFIAHLQMAIIDAERLNGADYSYMSWMEFQMALEVARAALNAETQEEVDAAIRTLAYAKAALVNISSLRADIDEAWGLSAYIYTDESWMMLISAIDEAEAAIANGTQDAIDAATSNLAEAKAALVNISALTEAIEKAWSFAEYDYTPESWAVLMAALEEAEAARTSKTQAQVDLVTEKLHRAISSLEKPLSNELAALYEAIAKAETLVESDYTASSWAAFKKALKAAKTANETTNIPTVVRLHNALIKAQETLVEAGYDILESYINKAETLNKANYTAISWYKLEKALNNAKRIYASDFKTEEEVEACARALEDAIASLEADTTKLDDLIFECEKLTNTDYTENTWRIFAAALAAAKANKSVDYEEVMALYNALVAARDALALFSADKTELKYLLTLASLFSEADFSVAEWASFAAKVAEANIVLNSEKATAPEVEAAVKKLKEAIKAINGGSLPTMPGEENSEEDNSDYPIEKPSEDPNETPIGKPSDNPGGEFGDDFGEDLEFADPMFMNMGCGGVVGTSAVVVALLLGMFALKKKED